MATETRIFITPGTILMTLALLLAVWVLYQVRDILVLLFLSCLIAAALYPTVEWLRQRKFPSQLSILLFYLLFIGAVVGIMAGLTNLIATEGGAFVNNLPTYMASARQTIEGLPFFHGQRQLVQSMLNNFQDILLRSAQLLSSAFTYFAAVFSGLLSMLTVLVLTFYLLSDIRHFETITLRLAPRAYRPKFQSLLRTAACKTGAYIRGQLLLMTVVGVAVWLGLELLGVHYAPMLGLIAFFLEIIPLVGPVLSAILAILVALGQDVTLALWVGVFYFVLQQLENYLLAPKILGNSVHLHPFWILLSLLTGASLLGVAGVLLAVPVAVVLRLLVQEFYIKQYLHESPDPEAVSCNESTAPA